MSLSPDRWSGLVLAAAVVLGCAALAARPAGTGAIIVAGLVGILGLLGAHPVRGAGHAAGAWSATRWAATVAVGAGAFAAARVLGSTAPVAPWALPVVAGIAATSIAEEAFFRRLVYGWLADWNHAAAVGAAAAAFAAVHVTTHGIGVLPLNFAAGLVFGWQRWSTGGWSAPAFTHVAANFLQLG